VPLLVGEVVRGKALAVVVEAAKVVDTEGNVIDFDEDDEDEDGAVEAAPGSPAAVEG
jgi:trigger factor